MAAKVFDLTLPAQGHGDIDLFGDHLQRGLNPRLPHRAQAVDIAASDHRGLGPHGQRAQHVLPRTDAGIEPDFTLIPDRTRNRRKLPDRRQGPIQLPPAMV